MPTVKLTAQERGLIQSERMELEEVYKLLDDQRKAEAAESTSIPLMDDLCQLEDESETLVLEKYIEEHETELLAV